MLSFDIRYPARFPYRCGHKLHMQTVQWQYANSIPNWWKTTYRQSCKQVALLVLYCIQYQSTQVDLALFQNLGNPTSRDYNMTCLAHKDIASMQHLAKLAFLFTSDHALQVCRHEMNSLGKNSLGKKLILLMF